MQARSNLSSRLARAQRIGCGALDFRMIQLGSLSRKSSVTAAKSGEVPTL